MNRIDALFDRLRREGRPALMPFVTAGDPDLETTAALIPEVLRAGADLVEIGIPYSDPIADGPVVAASYTRALRNGVRTAAIFETIRAVRAELAGTTRADAPLVAMGSYAIIHRIGVDRYLSDASGCGIDGLIVPDLPIEEAEGLKASADSLDLKLIQLVTPTTPHERARRITRTSTGFLYYVSVAGVTGERTALPPDLIANITRLRSESALPICVGFGISGPEQVRLLAPAVDGLIVGSALVRRLADGAGKPRADVVAEVGRFVAELAGARDGALTR